MRRALYLPLLGLALAGALEPARADVASPEKAAAMRKLYITKCAKCHRLYEPSSYSDEQWQVWMTKMNRKAKLKPEQEQALSRYIEENFRSPSKAR